MRQRIDKRLLDLVDQLAHADPGSAQVDQRITDDLAGTVVGDLTATIHRNYRNIARYQHVLHLAGLAKGEHRVMFQQPQFIDRIRHPVVGERTHRPPYRLVRLTAKATDF